MGILTRIEEIILLAVYHLDDRAYGSTVRQEVESMVGKSFSAGSIYVPLNRLAERGMLASNLSDPTPERGGRGKKFYTVTQAGRDALRKAKALQDAMWARMPSLEEL
ncbi:MAG: PadR family transcriptional regulator [Ardenticatenaceae bacterium]